MGSRGLICGLGGGRGAFHINIQFGDIGQALGQQRIIGVIQIHKHLGLFLASEQTAEFSNFGSGGIGIAQLDKVAGNTSSFQSGDLLFGGVVLIAKHGICTGGDNGFHIHFVPLAAGRNVILGCQRTVSTYDAIGLAEGFQNGGQAGNVNDALVNNGFCGGIGVRWCRCTTRGTIGNTTRSHGQNHSYCQKQTKNFFHFYIFSFLFSAG